MHICIVTTEYLPGPGGGVATYTHIMARLLIEAGHEVTVVVKQEGAECPWELPASGPLRVVPVPMVNRESGRSIWDDPDLYANEMIHLRCYAGVFAREVARRLPELHRERPFDLVLSQDVEAPTYLIQNERMLFNTMAEVPFIVFIHSPHRQIQLFNDASLYGRHDYHRVLYEEQSMALAVGLIAASQYMKDQMVAQMGFAEEAIQVIPLPLGTVPEVALEKNSVLPAEARGRDAPAPETRASRPLEAGEPQSSENPPRRLVYAGRIEPRKGLEYLLRAFAEIAPRHPELVLDLVGRDTLHPALGKTCSKVFLKPVPAELRKRVRFLGAVPREELWQLYREADLGVVPSRWEPFSFTCQEMMASGLPVVATTEGGMAEMIEAGQHGFLCPAHDVEALAEKIILALDKPLDELEQFGQAARKRIFDYCDNDRILAETLDYFQRIIDSNRASFAEHKRFRVPANLPYGDHPLREPHPAAAREAAAKIDRIAAIVTCYNLGAYLDECIHSLESQRRISPYIYIVNDGSTDAGTLTALERFRNRACIEVLDFPNGGLPVARQRGARAALEGGYPALMFIDADDAIEPTYLAKAVEVLNRHPEAGAVNAWTHTVGLMHTYWIPPHSQFPLLLAECLSTPAAVIRAEAYEAAGGVCADLKYAFEDWDFWIALCKTGYALLTIPEPLLRYRMREGSMSQEYLFATREHGRREILRRHADLHQRFASEVQLLTEGYVYFEQAKLRQQESDFQAQASFPGGQRPREKKVPLNKKIYRFFKKRIDRAKRPR